MRWLVNVLKWISALVKRMLKWVRTLPDSYRSFSLKAFEHLATKGKSREQQDHQYIVNGKPSELYDTYRLSLVSKAENLPLLRYEYYGGSYKWVAYGRNMDRKGATNISKENLKKYRFVLAHQLYNKSFSYSNWFVPFLKRYSSFNWITLQLLVWVERPLIWCSKRIFNTVSDRLSQPEVDRFLYLRACILLGKTGRTFTLEEVIKEVHGSLGYTTGQIIERKNFGKLVLDSLEEDGAIAYLGESCKLKGKALQLFQSMSEVRSNRYNEIRHNSQMRMLTMVLAIGVAAQLYQETSPHIPAMLAYYRASTLGDHLPVGLAFTLFSVAVALLLGWYKWSLNRQRNPKIKI